MLKHSVPSALPGRFVPALGRRWLTPLYDGLLRLGGREQAFKARLITQADIQPTEAVSRSGLRHRYTGHRPEAPPVDTGNGWDRWRSCHPQTGPGQGATRGCPETVRSGTLSWSQPYPDAAFDVVLSSLFFHHLDPPGRSRALAEVVRVPKSGGRLDVADWGRQASMLMTVLPFPDRLLDGLERTAPAFSGRPPSESIAAGLAGVLATGMIDNRLRVHDLLLRPTSMINSPATGSADL